MSNCTPTAEPVRNPRFAQNGLDFTPPDRSRQIFEVPDILTVIAALGGAIVISIEAIKFSF